MNFLAQKEQRGGGRRQSYGTLKTELEQVARQAADFQALLARVKALRQRSAAGAADQSVVIVTAENPVPWAAWPRIHCWNRWSEPWCRAPESRQSGPYLCNPAGAQVIAPADGKVLYAGPYHKSGQVLILEITTGYDVVLAGLGRVTVRPNDQLLAGEPVGTMPPDSIRMTGFILNCARAAMASHPAPWLKLNLRPAFGKANGT